MRILERILPGLYLLELFKHEDERGTFLKTFNSTRLLGEGISFEASESFITISRRNVLRGMHFQAGPSAHDKIVSCISGEILDVTADARQGSPSFNKPYSIKLDSRDCYGLFIGKGYAHGFLTVSEKSVVSYLVSKIHDPIHDSGVHWSSIDFDWPIQSPIVSLRDARLPPISNCKCEFS
jgi:dTDP-4-dehydrorhamnose 3,5-epimerase